MEQQLFVYSKYFGRRYHLLYQEQAFHSFLASQPLAKSLKLIAPLLQEEGQSSVPNCILLILCSLIAIVKWEGSAKAHQKHDATCPDVGAADKQLVRHTLDSVWKHQCHDDNHQASLQPLMIIEGLSLNHLPISLQCTKCSLHYQTCHLL